MNPLKTRTLKQRYELTDRRRLTWYAAVYGVPAWITEQDETGRLRRYQEVINHDAFTECLATGDEVIANINHNDADAFATRTDGTLLIQSDPYGLFCSCWIPETSQGDELLNRVQSGELDGSSFQFLPLEDRSRNGIVERLRVKLIDVCLTGKPAFPQTKGDVMLRTQNLLPFLMARYRYAKIKDWSIDKTGIPNNPGAR